MASQPIFSNEKVLSCQVKYITWTGLRYFFNRSSNLSNYGILFLFDEEEIREGCHRLMERMERDGGCVCVATVFWYGWMDGWRKAREVEKRGLR